MNMKKCWIKNFMHVACDNAPQIALDDISKSSYMILEMSKSVNLRKFRNSVEIYYKLSKR